MAAGRAGGASNYRGFVIVKMEYRCPTHGLFNTFRDRVYDKSRKGEVKVVETQLGCPECNKGGRA